MEVLIGYWTDELFEIALWKTKRKGKKWADGKFPVYISKEELDSHYVSMRIERK